MAESNLLCTNEGPVRILTMNRPAKLNALDTPLTQALADALAKAGTDDSVRAVVLEGAGKGFCAGADLGEFADLTPGNQDAVLRRADLTAHLQSCLPKLAKPVIAAVHGAAVGGGAGLAVGCDMMVCTAGTKFGYPELAHSIVPALVMTGLQRALGANLAFELFSTGRMLSGQELFDLGLANRLVEPDDLLPSALALAQACAKADPRAMRASKALFYRVADMPYDQAMAAGRDVNALMRSFRT